jgi:hypothetical protein
MSIQRLKFAHARGARIQFRHYRGSAWLETSPTPAWRANSYRIHPDDAHMEYGHLSRALRDSTITSDVDAWDTYQAAITLIRHHAPAGFIALDEDSATLLGMFKLFFAEMLADEGL